MPYGAAGWERKKRLLEDIIASRSGPPFIYNDLLILLPSTRMCRTYAKLLLDIVHRVHGAASFVQPDLSYASPVPAETLYAPRRPPAVDEDTRLVPLEGMVQGRHGKRGFQPASGHALRRPPNGPRAMIEQLRRRGRDFPGSSRPGFRKRMLLTGPRSCCSPTYAGYEQALAERGLSDPAGSSSPAGRFDPQQRLSVHTTIPYRRDPRCGRPRDPRSSEHCGRGTVHRVVDAPSSALRCAGEFHPLRVTKTSFDGVGLLSGEDAAVPDEDTRFLVGSAVLGQSLYGDYGRGRDFPFPEKHQRPVGCHTAR